MKPKALKRGDTIGIIAPSDCIVGEKREEVLRAREIVERDGFKVKFAKNLFSDTNGYSATVHEKAEDLNAMFADDEVKMVLCAKGGENSNSLFEYIDYENIKKHPKIFCGYSDITSIINMISEKSNLVTFSAMNFRTIVKDEESFSYNEVINRFVNGSLEFGRPNGKDEYITIKEGIADHKFSFGILKILLLNTMIISLLSIKTFYLRFIIKLKEAIPPIIKIATKVIMTQNKTPKKE